MGEETPVADAEMGTPLMVMKFVLPRDREWFEASYHGLDWKDVVMELDNRLRSWIKHGNNFGTVDEALEEARGVLYDEMEARNIVLD